MTATLLLVSALLQDRQPQVLCGQVIRFIDGDTLTLLDSSRQTVRVRLRSIDAPERRQPFGPEARDALAGQVAGQPVRVYWTERDRYGRILGDVWTGSRWLNGELVAQGLAWQFDRYSDSTDLAATQLTARRQRRGLWQDPQPVPPWQWRRR